MFPVCTGMNRLLLSLFLVNLNVPRMHGDEPFVLTIEEGL